MDGFDAALARYRAFLASEPIAPLLRRSLALLVPDNIRIDTVTPDDSLRCTTDGTSVTVGGAAYLLRADFDARHWTAALRVLLARELQHDGSSDRDVCAAVRAFSGAYFHEHYALTPELGALLGQRILNILEQARTDNILCRRFPGYLPLLRFVCYAQLDAAAPGTEFLADAQVQFPPASTEELETAMFRDVIGTCTTTCAGPWGRRQNIKLASAAIDGRIYNPGEEFWYNATVGQRTEARGFQPAAAYSGGKTVTSIGGGICQVSSTLYYAALMADLKIVLRYAHMFDPGYMPVTGCDATVSWGGPDFAFRNSTDYPIKITTSYNDETNQLTITLLGTKTNDNYVEMTNQFLSYSERKTVYQESERIAPGTTEVEQYGHNGYAVQTYRNVYAGDGTLLRSTKEAYSDYDRADKIILVAPGELPQ